MRVCDFVYIYTYTHIYTHITYACICVLHTGMFNTPSNWATTWISCAYTIYVICIYYIYILKKKKKKNTYIQHIHGYYVHGLYNIYTDIYIYNIYTDNTYIYFEI